MKKENTMSSIMNLVKFDTEIVSDLDGVAIVDDKNKTKKKQSNEFVKG